MSLPTRRPPLHDDPSRSEGATSSWAADVAEADPAWLSGNAAAPQQMPLFHADDLAPATASARPRRARLPSRLKALLTAPPIKGARPPAMPDGSGLPDSSSWPDSFFDLHAGS